MSTGSMSFSNYAFVPLAFPKPSVDLEKLKRFLQENCNQCRFAENKIKYIVYLAREQLRANGQFTWKGEFSSRFPEFVAWFEALPFLQIYGVDFVTQTDDIGDHLDIFGNNNSETQLAIYEHVEPMYYRAIFSDQGVSAARNNSFYVTREFRGDRHYIRLPDETDLFALNSSICYHGATYNSGVFKSTMAMYGKLDEARHYQLLRKSLSTFPDSAIAFSRVEPVSGPGAQFPYPGALYNCHE